MTLFDDGTASCRLPGPRLLGAAFGAYLHHPRYVDTSHSHVQVNIDFEPVARIVSPPGWPSMVHTLSGTVKLCTRVLVWNLTRLKKPVGKFPWAMFDTSA